MTEKWVLEASDLAPPHVEVGRASSSVPQPTPLAPASLTPPANNNLPHFPGFPSQAGELQNLSTPSGWARRACPGSRGWDYEGGGTARRSGGRGLPLGRFSDGSSPAPALWVREEGAGERALPEPARERPSRVWGVGAMAPAVDRKGYWGPTTSTLDWCEENYAVTLFVAEFCEWSLRRGARARAEGRRVENAEGEPGREGRLQAGPGSGSWACAAVGSRGADVAASCARAGFRGPSGWGRKGRPSRA